jgi:aspartate racemase
MKMLGLIGGMSWESTAIYYRIFNEAARSRFGGLHSADLLVRSFDFERIAALQASAGWGELEVAMTDAARRLEGAGAQALLICSNTMHRLYEQTQAAVAIPVLHIVDATAEALQVRGCSRPLLLATRYTMEQSFYRGRLTRKYGIDALVPDEAGRAMVHSIIYNELCQGAVNAASKAAYLAEIGKAKAAGADSVILGCTEVCMLIGQRDLDLPAFDTTALHVAAAMAFSAS